MSDNPVAPVVENPVTQTEVTSGEAAGEVTISNSPENAGLVTDAPATWKANLGTDLRDSPLLQKFEDTPDGLNKAMESHANLEKLLGHDKVPIPKDAE